VNIPLNVFFDALNKYNNWFYWKFKFTHPNPSNVQIYTMDCQQQNFKLQNSALFLLTAFEKLEMVGKDFIFKLPYK
jgi:hypothetical protein